MTIRFVTAWNGYHADQIVSGLGSTEESRLIGLGYAVADLDGPGNTPLPVFATKDLTGGSIFSAGGKVIPGYQRLRSKGAILSMMDGAKGETVAIVSTPSGGSWADSSVPRFSTPTKKITIPAQNTGGTIQINAPSGRKFGRVTSQDSFVVLLYLESVNADDTVILTLSPNNMTDGTSATRALSVNKSPGYWYELIDVADMSGSATLPCDIDSIRVRVARANTAGNETRVHVCGVIKAQRHVPTVIFDFDDGFASQYTNAFQTMSSYGLVGSVAVIAATVGQSSGGLDAYDYCTLKQLQEMKAAGWGMLTHGYYAHNSGTLNSYANIKADVAANQAYVAANLPGPGQNHYVLPAGQQHSSTDQVLSELGFLSCRATASGMQTELPDGVDNIYRLFSVGISASTGLAALKARFDTARKTGTTLRYCGHRILGTVTDSGNEILNTDFETLCAYLAPYVASGEVENVTAADWYSRRLFG